MASEIRVNTINNRSGLGTISLTNSGAVFSGVTTFAQIKTTSGEVTVGTGASVFSPATNVLALGTNNAERVRISSTGSVGIGTDNPGSNLHIKTTSSAVSQRIESTGNNASLFLLSNNDSNANTAIWFGESGGNESRGYVQYYRQGDYLRFGANSFERLRITSSGNIGIGTTNPATNFKLDVNGDLSLGEYGGADNSFIDQKQNGSLEIINSGRSDNDGKIRINRFNNISGDTTYYRDFELYDGKSNKIIEVDGSAAMTRIHMGTDKVVQFQGNIGEIGSVAGFQATNTAGSANTDFGIRATTIRFATGSSERLRINSSGNLILDAGGDAQDIQIISHSAGSGHGQIYLRGNASAESSSIKLNHFGYADYVIAAGRTGNGLFSITGTDGGTDGIIIDTSGRTGVGIAPSNFGNNANSLELHSPISTQTFLSLTNTTTGSNGASNGLNLAMIGSSARFLNRENGEIQFQINGNERMRILAAGGITFNGDTAAANALDDYEEGEWTPNVGGNATYTTQHGWYVKVGQLVTCYFYMLINIIGSGNNDQIGGLPYTAQSTISTQGAIAYFSDLSTNVYWVGVTGGANDTNLFLRCQTSLDGSVNSSAGLLGSGSAIGGSVTYRSSS